MEHTADLCVRVRGEGVEDILVNAAYALFDLQYRLERVRTVEVRELRITAPDLEVALVRMLSDLICVSESESLVFRDFEVRCRADGGTVEVTCRAHGDRFDPGRHEPRLHVKAVSYHMLRFEPEEGYAIVVFDT